MKIDKVNRKNKKMATLHYLCGVYKITVDYKRKLKI